MGRGKGGQRSLGRDQQYPIDHPTNLADERGTSSIPSSLSSVKPAIPIGPPMYTKQPITSIPSHSCFVNTLLRCCIISRALSVKFWWLYHSISFSHNSSFRIFPELLEIKKFWRSSNSPLYVWTNSPFQSLIGEKLTDERRIETRVTGNLSSVWHG